MSAAGLFLLSTKDDFVNLLDFLDAKTIFTNVVCLGKTLRDAPVAARGGQCPLRKSSSPIQLPLVDYARHVSHREQLSRAVGEGSEGEVASFEGDDCPSQLDLLVLAAAYPGMVSLSISGESSEEALSFAEVRMPQLVDLTLGGVRIESLKLTSANMPSLRTLDLSSIDELALFDLELPELRMFTAEHTMLGGPDNSFGLSMSRCPKLERIYGYKFRYLSGRNFCVLPSCETITLYRCECSDSLEILSAPKLTELSVRASYDLSNLRLEDFAAATVEDVERMCAAEEKVRSATQAAIAEELSRWTSGEKGGEDAVRMGWCEQASDFDPDHVAVDSNGFLPGYDDGGGWEAELIGEYLETMVQRQYARSWETTRRQICDDLRQRSSSIMPRQDLPPCSLVTVNMELDVPSRAHFANHTLTGRIVDGNDEENEFF